MFTGIVEEVGTIKVLNSDSMVISAAHVMEGIKLGDSVSVDGACLTVTKLDKNNFTVEIMPETKRLTNLANLHVRSKVNFERALPAQGRFGGHFVQGHVDGIGTVVSLHPEAKAVIATFTASSEILRYLVKKGFIAVNGVSLTVTQCNKSQFSISLVTFSRDNTNLGLIAVGDTVNLEVDIIAKYIEKFYHPNKQNRIDELLVEYDYLEAR